MVEIFVLFILSMLIGVGAVQQEHWKIRGLVILMSIITIGMLSLIVIGHHVTIEILVLTILGMLLGGAVAKIWHMVIVKNKSQNNRVKSQRKMDPNLSKDYMAGFNAEIKKKYPEKPKEDWGEQLQKNFQTGLAKKYPN